MSVVCYLNWKHPGYLKQTRRLSTILYLKLLQLCQQFFLYFQTVFKTPAAKVQPIFMIILKKVDEWENEWRTFISNKLGIVFIIRIGNKKYCISLESVILILYLNLRHCASLDMISNETEPSSMYSKLEYTQLL